MIIMKVKVKDAYKEDIGKGILRIDPDLKRELNFSINDVMKIVNQKNSRITAAILKLGKPLDKSSKTIRIDANLRRNLGVSIDDYVEISKINEEIAKVVFFTSYIPNITIKNPNQLANKLEGIIITKDDTFSFNYKGKTINLVVSNYTPQSEAVIIQKDTSIIFQDVISQEFNNANLYKLYKNLYSEINYIKSNINKFKEELTNLKQSILKF